MRVCIALLAVAVLQNASADSITWTPSGFSDDWASDGNWSDGLAPITQHYPEGSGPPVSIPGIWPSPRIGPGVSGSAGAVSGRFDIDGGRLTASSINGGYVEMSNGAQLNLGAAGSITGNLGSVELRTNSSITTGALTHGAGHLIYGDGRINAGQQLTNSGTLYNDDSGTLSVYAGTITNSGWLRSVDTGTLALYSNTVQNSGGKILAGGSLEASTVNFASNPVITGGEVSVYENSQIVGGFTGNQLGLYNGGLINGNLVLENSYFNNFGPVIGTVHQKGGMFANFGSILGPWVMVEGGIFYGAQGTMSGDLINIGGSVSPGASPGCLSMNGDYTQGAAAAMNIELGGTSACTGYDRLSAGNDVALSGALNVSLVNGFVPLPGMEFRFLEYSGSLSGSFTQYNGLDLGNGLHLTPQYGEGYAALLVESSAPIPEPGTWFLMGAGVLLLRRRYQTLSLRLP